MRILCAICLAISVWASGAVAQVIAQSGDHEAFSRIVFPYPAQMDWSLEKTEGGHDLKFTRGELAVDVENVLRFLPSGRLQAVSANSQGLRILHQCQCEVEVFRFNGTHLVIDIKEPRPAFPTSTYSELSELSRELLKLPINSISEQTVIVLGEDLQATDVADLGDNSVADEEINVEQIQNTVVRAIEGGLISAFENDNFTTSIRGPKSSARNVRLNGEIFSLETQESGFEAHNCLGAYLFLDTTTWQENEAELRDAIAHRARLLDANFSEDPQRARQLAEGYLRLGFGAEARQVLEVFGIEDPVLHSLSHAVEGGSPENVEMFRNLERCDNFASAWGALVNHADSDFSPNVASITRTLANTPSDVRTRLFDALLYKLPLEAEQLRLEMEPLVTKSAPVNVGLSTPGSVVQMKDELLAAIARDATLSTDRLRIAESILTTAELGDDREALFLALNVALLIGAEVEGISNLLRLEQRYRQSMAESIVREATQRLNGFNLARFASVAEAEFWLPAAQMDTQIELLRKMTRNGSHALAQRILDSRNWAQTNTLDSLQLAIDSVNKRGRADVMDAPTRSASSFNSPDVREILPEDLSLENAQRLLDRGAALRSSLEALIEPSS